tara:strand:- start:9233 stop:10006 length:774 start_codon:yes stop_codon:yes gene_type:complete
MKIKESTLRRIIVKKLLEDVPSSFNVENLGGLSSWLTDPLDKYAGRADVDNEIFKIAPETSDISLSRSSQEVRRFASAVGIISDRMGLETPVVTSGKRSAQEQAVAMLMKFKSGEDLLDLYVYECSECLEIVGDETRATDLINSIVDIFAGMSPGGDLSESEAVRKVSALLRATRISAHQAGMAIDFRPTQGLEGIFSALRDYASFNTIDETSRPGASHWHVFVKRFSRRSYEDVVENLRRRRPQSQEGIDPEQDID